MTTLSMPRAWSRFHVSWPSSVMASSSAISIAAICRVHASRILHLTAQSQPMSWSSIGSAGSRLGSGQHHAVPQRSAEESGTGVLANGASLARFRWGVSL
jgi:hypothetical protein